MNYRLRSEDLDWKQIDDEIVILDGNRAAYLSVEGSGVVLWHALQVGSTREALIDALVAAYGIDRDRAGTDVDAFLTTLAEKDLLAS